mmetsp:Transcript_75663/g.202537  ORF Transcript_75663/g.202537 Transcript_75663/m.202537 type:complete len:169 (+) Transcript_75663:486-992(+)
MVERKVKFADELPSHAKVPVSGSVTENEARALRAQKCAIEAMQQARSLRTEIAKSPATKKAPTPEKPLTGCLRRSSFAESFEFNVPAPKRSSSAGDQPFDATTGGDHHFSVAPRRTLSADQINTAESVRSNQSAPLPHLSPQNVVLEALSMSWLTQLFDRPDTQVPDS